MKLTSLLLVVTLFQLHANKTLSQNKKISIDMQDVTIENVINEIEIITDFKFLYEKDTFEADKLVKVSAKNEKLSSVLNKLFINSNVSIVFLEKQIHIKHKEGSVIPKENVKPLIKAAKIQQLQISGTVVDENDQPLPGVSILIKDSTLGTETDFDGVFSLEAVKGNVLVLSFIGMTTQEVTIGNEVVLNVKMIADGAELEEIVIERA
jgi:hypothetical protein